MEGRSHVCAKCDWRPTGEVWPFYVYDQMKRNPPRQNRPIVWLRCALCKSPGFRHPDSEVVYTWELGDPPTSLPRESPA